MHTINRQSPFRKALASQNDCVSPRKAHNRHTHSIPPDFPSIGRRRPGAPLSAAQRPGRRPAAAGMLRKSNTSPLVRPDVHRRDRRARGGQHPGRPSGRTARGRHDRCAGRRAPLPRVAHNILILLNLCALSALCDERPVQCPSLIEWTSRSPFCRVKPAIFSLFLAHPESARGPARRDPCGRPPSRRKTPGALLPENRPPGFAEDGPRFSAKTHAFRSPSRWAANTALRTQEPDGPGFARNPMPGAASCSAAAPATASGDPKGRQEIAGGASPR